jgi:hypothetical protein
VVSRDLAIVHTLSPIVGYVLKNPVVSRTAENQHTNWITGPICPLVFLLSLFPSGRWMVGAVGIETTSA